LDTSILIYQVEQNARYFPLSDAIFAWLERRGNSAITSTLAMTELLVPAYRDGDSRRLDVYHGLLPNLPNLEWIAPDLEIADLAARLRATHKLKTPDAIHAATAINAQASGFLTNDPVFQRIKELDTLVLDEVL
jgi:predicted nucleic acid-binding protein